VLSGAKEVVVNHRVLPQIDFWEPTRILPPVGASIAEFPYFTYLFADLHPHLIAYPITAAAIAFAVCLARTRYRGLEALAAVLTGGLILGAIAVVNPWDFPTYLILAGVGAGVGSYFAVRRLSPRLLIRPVLWVAGLGIISSVAYLPFKLGYQTVFQTGLGLTRDITPQLLGPDITASDAHDILVTPLRLYLEHFGLFLFIIVSYLLLLLTSRRRPGASREAVGPIPSICRLLSRSTGAGHSRRAICQKDAEPSGADPPIRHCSSGSPSLPVGRRLWNTTRTALFLVATMVGPRNSIAATVPSGSRSIAR